MKTLYLHIGMPKTATSSIQRFLQINRKALKKHGFCYPGMPHKYPDIHTSRNGHFLVGKAYRENGSRASDLDEQYFQDGMKTLWRSFKKYDNVILSEETLWRHFSGTHKDIFPNLQTDSAEHGYQVKIIVYLRRQDEFQISNWNERVKHSKLAMTLSFEERFQQVLDEEADILDYAARIDEIAGYFGKENVIVRRFEPESWIKGSIIDDFMHCIGLEVTEDFVPLPNDSNLGLYGNTVEIKRIINKNTSFAREENVFFGHILKDMSVESGKRYPCNMLSPEETRTFLERYAEGNAHVANVYIHDGKPLFSDRVKNLPKWQPDNPYMTEDIIQFFSQVSINLYRENQALRSDLTKLQTQFEREQQNLRTFKNKLKHPFRTLWCRIFD